MPLYEYLCDACGHAFEKIQKFSDPLETTCPKCGGAVHKLMSSPAIQFKGSGWYITDYAKKDSSAGKPDAAKSETKTESSDKGTASETKSDASTTKSETSAAATKGTTT
jgi:putative FmdB family regulatory protein